MNLTYTTPADYLIQYAPVCIEDGEIPTYPETMLFVIGKQGSGKSTFVHQLLKHRIGPIAKSFQELDSKDDAVHISEGKATKEFITIAGIYNERCFQQMNDGEPRIIIQFQNMTRDELELLTKDIKSTALIVCCDSE